MADFSIKTNITANTQGFKSGINTALKATTGFKNSISNLISGLGNGQGGLVGTLTNVGFAMGSIGVVLGTAKKAFQVVAKVVNECTEAYKKQHIEEEQLRLAVQNSTAVTSESSRVLMDYASSLQKASNYGDEELLPMMTKLIASGRTEAETMKIMKTAIDMSATGTVSLDTAVTQLNQTLNGSAGRLAMQNKELKGLTQEELENGKAVDILAKKYDGMASKAVDSSKQLKNAWGDLKETLGKSFENAMSPMKNFFATLIQGWADARKARQDYEDAKARTDAGKGTAEDLQILIENNKKIIDDWNAEIERLAGWYNKKTDEIKEKWDSYYKKLASGKNAELTTGDIQALEQENRILQNKINIKKQQEEQAKATAEAEAKALAEEQERLDRWKQTEEDIGNLKKRYEEAEQKQLITWEQREKILGETVTLEEKIKWYQEQLVAIMAEANGQITEGNSYYDKQITKINELKKGLQGAEKPAEKLNESFEKMTDVMKNKYKSVFSDVFEKLGQNLVEGKHSFEDYASTAVSSIAEILQALGEQLSAQVAVNLATGNFAGAGIALAGATSAFIASGALSAVANKMTAVKEETNSATSAIEAFKQSLKEIQESRFTKSGTITLGLVEMQEQLDTLREKQELLKKNSIVTYDAKTIKALESVGIRKDDVKVWHEYQETLKQIKVTENELAEALENVRSSLDKTVNENRKVINSYKDFYGASKLIADSAEYQFKKYSTYLEMIKDEQKISLQELELEVYETFQSFGRNIGEAMMSSFINGTDKTEFFDEMKKMIKETVLKMAVYTESFTEQLSEVGADLVNALMGGDDFQKVTERITTLYDETSKVAEQFAGKIDDIFGKVEKSMGIAISQFAKNMKAFKETIKDVTGDLGQTFINGLTEGMTQGDFLTNIKDYLKKLMIQMVVYTDTMKAEIEEIGKRISAGIVDGFTDTDLHEIRRDLSYMFEEASQKVQSIEGILGGVFGGYATGTDNARRGLAMVGEAGPELVKFRGGEQVLNARSTQRALNGMAGNTNNFNVTFNNTTDTSAFAMVSQLKAYNRQLAINGVI